MTIVTGIFRLDERSTSDGDYICYVDVEDKSNKNNFVLYDKLSKYDGKNVKITVEEIQK